MLCLRQTAADLPDNTCDGEGTYPLRDPVVRNSARLKWYLWHGNVFKALQVVPCVEMDLDAAMANDGDRIAQKLLKAVLLSPTSDGETPQGSNALAGKDILHRSRRFPLVNESA